MWDALENLKRWLITKGYEIAKTLCFWLVALWGWLTILRGVTKGIWFD